MSHADLSAITTACEFQISKHVCPNTARGGLQVEKSWEEVVKDFPPPLHRQRYGS